MTFTALLAAALRFQRRHILGRTVAVATGLVMVVAVLELQAALDRGVEAPPADLGPSTAVVVRSSPEFSTFGAAQRPGIGVEGVAAIAASPGVGRAEGEDQGRIGVVHEGARRSTRLGTWFEDDGFRPVSVLFGAPPVEATVAVTTSLADDLGLEVGDPIELVGRVRTPTTVAAIVEARAEGADAPDVYAPLLAANAVVGTEGRVGRVVVAGSGTAEELASAVYVANPELETLTRARLDDERTRTERDRAAGTRRLLTLFAGIAVAVTALIVVSGTAAAVVRRTGELATLRTAGATPRQVRTLVLAEAATVGVVGGLLAGPLGTAAAGLLHRGAGGLGLTTTDAAPRLDLGVLAAAVVLGVGLGLVGAWFPARRAGRLSVRAALGDLAQPAGRIVGRAAVVGVAVAAAGLIVSGTGARADADLGRAGLAGLLLVVGSCILAAAAVGAATALLASVLPSRRWPVGRLAVGNLARSPARTAGTAVSILVGVGLVMLTNVLTSSFQANVATSVDRLYRADVVVAGEGEVPGVARADAEAVADTFGVEASTPVREGSVKVGADVATAIALDPAAELLGPAFSTSAARAFASGDGGILVRAGLGPSRGTDVTVTGAEGAVETTVAGTFTGRLVDGSGGRIDVVVPLDLADDVLPPGPDRAVLARTIGDVGPAEVARLAGADPALQASSLGAFGRRTAASADRAFALSVALLAMTLVTSVIGLANTVAASVAERRREVSVLRALGLGAGQLARLVTLETAILAAMVAVAATVVAAATGAMLVGSVAPEGTPISVPWVRLALIGAAATALCSLAGLVPALRATRIPVNEGLVDE
jgi:putative ABC transport system permease protein